MTLDILIISVRMIAVGLCVLLLYICHNGRHPGLRPVRVAAFVSAPLALTMLAFDLGYLLSFISLESYSQYRRIPGNLLLVVYPLLLLLSLVKHDITK